MLARMGSETPSEESTPDTIDLIKTHGWWGHRLHRGKPTMAGLSHMWSSCPLDVCVYCFRFPLGSVLLREASFCCGEQLTQGLITAQSAERSVTGERSALSGTPVSPLLKLRERGRRDSRKDAGAGRCGGALWKLPLGPNAGTGVLSS